MSDARLLDLTRSLRRAGRMATGIDRVERAYLARFLQDDAPCFALVRSRFGYILLDRTGMERFQAALTGAAEWGPLDGLSRVTRKAEQSLLRAESLARRVAVARCLPMRLTRMMALMLPMGFDYFNVGHSNLTERVLRCVGYAGGKVQVLIHDMIPLEHPEWQRAGTVRPFEARLRRVSEIADRAIFNSAATEAKVADWMREKGRCPPSMVAHLGASVATPAPDALPKGLPLDAPYFVTVGTIEPRKNHALLLDLWERLGANAPNLFICGDRGWNNEAVFKRLDQLPKRGSIRELSGLSDGAVSALIQGSAGFLFPSLAEGFGLPPVEARMLGARVLCNDLPALREVLDAGTTFAPVFERDLWLRTVKDWGNKPPEAGIENRFEGPSWDAHFNAVLRLT